MAWLLFKVVCHIFAIFACVTAGYAVHSDLDSLAWTVAAGAVLLAIVGCMP